MIKAVIFDLDDTLFPEIEYVKSGFKAIADSFGDPDICLRLYSLFKEDRKNVYQRMGFNQATCERCIQIYREHKPDLQLSIEAKQTLLTLKNNGYKLGIITDGRPNGQWNKIRALGLDKIIDNIVVTDELGGIEYRKPNPKSFEIMREKMNCSFKEMLYIGDNPLKDFAAPKLLGMRTCLYTSNDGLYIGEFLDGCNYRITDITRVVEILEKDSK